jgi:tRNA threonylcarbamoyladenosine biosynthesis protein TsaB
MMLILNIETAVDTASVCLSDGNHVLSFMKNESKKDHAAWLHPAIENTMKKTTYKLPDLAAIAVSIGPGSYTGLRIGLAAAKGLCYALQKPLITINTLQVMALAAIDYATDLICPMIDARRMEVFTGLFNKSLKTVMEPKALVVDEKSFAEQLVKHEILFFGTGSEKFKTICKDSNAVFENILFDAADMVTLSEKQFAAKEFADLTYAEPLYLKEFFTPGH